MPDTRDTSVPAERQGSYPPERRLALVDLLDRVLAGGVVLRGELSLCIADIELVRVSLRAVVASVSSLAEATTTTADEPGRTIEARAVREPGAVRESMAVRTITGETVGTGRGDSRDRADDDADGGVDDGFVDSADSADTADAEAPRW
jgi:hypothetical protein